MQKLQNKFKIEDMMTDIMDIIHYETILNDNDRYLDFVEGVKKGQLILN